MKVVTVGTSHITELLIKGFKESGIEVFACIGRDPEKTKEFAKKNDIQYHAYNYDSAIKSKNFDTVYLGLPNSLHYEYAKKALENNKNVIVEKPFAPTLKQAKELISYANAHNLFIFDATTTLHLESFKQLRKDLSLIGSIRMVNLDFSKYSSKYDAFLNGETPNIFSNKFCGGALMDLGIYNIAFAVGLFGLPKSVRYFPNMQRGIDTSGVAILKYPDFIANLTQGKDSDLGSSILIKGEKGYIESNQFTSNFNEYTIHLNDGTVRKKSFEKKYQYLDELSFMKSIHEYKNIRKNNEYLTLTLMNIKVLEELRNSCEIDF